MTTDKDLERARQIVADLIEKAVEGAITAATELGYIDELRARLAGEEAGVIAPTKKPRRSATSSAPDSPAKRLA